MINSFLLFGNPLVIAQSTKLTQLLHFTFKKSLEKQKKSYMRKGYLSLEFSKTTSPMLPIFILKNYFKKIYSLLISTSFMSSYLFHLIK